MRPQSLPSRDPYFARRAALDVADQVAVHRAGKAPIIAGHYRRDTPGLGLTKPNDPSDTIMCVVHLRDRPRQSLWRSDQHFRLPEMKPGSFVVLDQREVGYSDLAAPFETLNLFFPIADFLELYQEHRQTTMLTFHCPPEDIAVDEVMHHLAQALAPAIAKPAEASALFCEHVFSAARLHVATRYGGLAPRSLPQTGCLAPWQLRRAQELLLDDLRFDIGTTELAAACGLSTSHFARAFKRTTGSAPHQWRQERRVEKAQAALASTTLPISHIALACGFADQSHLTRVFSRIIGVSPGLWRRQRVN
jgi:AraC family transcriptional regulator